MHRLRFCINKVQGRNAMKTKNIIKKLYQAAVSKDKSLQQEYYQKLLDKSLKNKYTYAVK
jgi:hypothetical protein